MEQLSPALIAIQDHLQGEKIRQRFEDILGAKAPAFAISVMQYVTANINLHACDKESIINAAIEIALLGLPLSSNLMYAYINDYDDNGKVVAQCNIGWRGYVQLAQRTDKFKTINVSDVREGEMKGTDRLKGTTIFDWNHDEQKRKSLPIVGWVSYFELLNGFEKTNYKTVQELREHSEKWSKKFRAGNWGNDIDAMCARIVVKKILADWAPLSDHVEIARAIKADQAVITGDGQYSYPDNPQSENKPEKPTGKVKAANTIEEVNKLLHAGRIKKANTKKK